MIRFPRVLMRLRGSGRAVAWVVAGPVLLLAGCSVPGPVDGDPLPKAELVFDELRSAMLSVSGTGSDDVYFVGADLGEGDGPNVLHFDGTGWRRIGTGLDSGNLWWISVTPIDGAFYLAGDPGLLLRFDVEASSFEQMAMPDDRPLFGVWGTASDDLWVVGGDLDEPDTGGVIRHFDGASWTEADLGEVLPEGVPTLYKVWGRSATEVYVVGRLGTLLRFDGTSWEKLDSGTTRTLFTVHGNDSLTAACGGFGEGVIVESSSGGPFANKAAPGTPQLNGICVPTRGTAVAAGYEASLVFREAGAWVEHDTELDTFRDLHAVWIDPDGGVWAAGGDLSASLDDGIVVYYGTREIPRTIRD